MSSSPTPRLLLEALQSYLSPDILISKIPTALQIFAHLQLLSAQIISEATRVLAEQEALQDELMAEEVPPEEWTARGVLSRRDARAVRKWAARGKGVDTMFAFSLGLRKQHILRVMATPHIKPERVYPLVELYFPAPSAENDIDDPNDETSPRAHLYIRMMTELQRSTLEAFRQEVLKIFDDFQKYHAAGRPPSIPSSLAVSSGGRDPLAVAGENLLKEAVGVVKDAEDFEAMFASVDKADIPLPALVKKEESSPNQDRDLAGHPVPREVKMLDSPISHRRPKPPSLPVKSEFKPLNRRSAKPAPPAPDYSRPVPKLGANVSKAQRRPFDNEDLKRPRSGVGVKKEQDGAENNAKRARVNESRRYTEDDDEVYESARRKVLREKGALKNSQSSGESQETKERRRHEKGKGRSVLLFRAVR